MISVRILSAFFAGFGIGFPLAFFYYDKLNPYKAAYKKSEECLVQRDELILKLEEKIHEAIHANTGN